ncbi:hypothetical protein [Lichenibacterium dinghuense]|uniref:hypothetical protein n=1 Tax=Lichenibacterium dinghuense TaxID=2895977 RepID=UPI001F3996C3|nr:hypothetical protein [Lichenibacterium sp. 6Y81]
MTARLVSVDPVIVVDDVPSPGTARAPRPPSGSGEFLDRLGGAVSDKPGAAALIGLGAAWFLVKASGVALPSLTLARSTGQRQSRGAVPPPQRALPNPSARSGDASSGVGEAVAGAASAVGGSVSRAAAAVGGAASSASAQVTEAASAGAAGSRSMAVTALRTVSGAGGTAYDAVSDAGSSAYEAVSHAGSTAYDASMDASRSVAGMAEALFLRQPLVVGALALAVGGGLAALMPRSEVEDRYLGEVSDDAKSKAKAFAAKKAEVVQGAAKDAIDGAVATAKEQGLSASGAADLVRKAGDKLGKVASAAGDSLKAELK